MQEPTEARGKFRLGLVTLATTLVMAGYGTGASTEVAVKPVIKASLPAVPRNGELGFTVTDFSPAIVPGAVNCPNGHAGNLLQNFLDTLSAEERARLTRKGNETEMYAARKKYGIGPTGLDICTGADVTPGAALVKDSLMPQSNIAYGLDLDAGDKSSSSKTCAHGTFTSPTGEKGIDNEAYRVLGCWDYWRSDDGTPGPVVIHNRGGLANATASIVMVIRGIDSWVKDDNVEVILASTLNAQVTNAQGKAVPDTTFEVSDNPRWRNVLKGRIVDGVLQTSPADIVLKRAMGIGGIQGLRGEWRYLDVQLRLKVDSDGVLSGLMGGYTPFKQMIETHMLAGEAAAFSANYDCASLYNSMKKLADGRRDPKTGMCTAISTALHFAAVPAFVLDNRPGRTQSASNRSAFNRAER